MAKIDLDTKNAELLNFEEEAEDSFYYLSKIEIVSLDEDRRMVEVELLPEGKWKRPQGNGWFEVARNKIQEFINNFKSGITGRELPLDFNHIPDSRTTPGWIVGMREKINKDGNLSIFAKMQITDPEVWERIKQKSLKYISPQIIFGWVQPKSNKRFDVIKSAALTNYPYLKGMESIKILNFEEVQKREEVEKEVKKYDEFMEKLDVVLAEELEEEAKDKKLKALCEEYGMDLEDATVAKKKKEKEELEEKAKVEAKEKLELEEKAKAEAKEKLELEEKAKADAIKLKEKVDEKRLAKFEEEKKELNSRILMLEEQVESKKADEMVVGFKRAGVLSPAKAPIIKALLMGGRSQTLNFEEKETNVRDLVIQYFEEGNKIANFEEIASQELEEGSVKSLDKMTQEEINAEAEAVAKEENIRFEEALDKVTDKHFKAPK